MLQYRSEILNSRMGIFILLLFCSSFAVWCGYTAAEHSDSMIGMFKMTLGMCVLSCIVITDMELMIIPNLCSLVLLG